jgi:hypothetical protein
MIEQYRGYEIKVYWSNIDLGYVFCVFSMDGKGIMESGTYFYEAFSKMVYPAEWINHF